MRRKVSKIGSSTLMVSLPSKWCKANGLKKGDEVELQELSNVLQIAPPSKQVPLERITINAGDLSRDMIQWVLGVCHKAGYDEVEVLFNSPAQLQIIRDRIKSMLVGYEIIEQSNTRCLIKYLVGEGKPEVDHIIRRIFLVLQSFADESYKALSEKRQADLDELLALEDTINRLTNLVERMIHKESFKNRKSIFLYIIIWLLESISDEYRDVCLFFSKKKDLALRKEALELFRKTNNLLQDYSHCYYTFSLEKYQEVARKQKTVREAIEQFSAKNDEEIRIASSLSKMIGLMENLHGSTIGLFITKHRAAGQESYPPAQFF